MAARQDRESAGALTTHVLDTVRGGPAPGIEIELYRIDGSGTALVTSATTNADGRADRPLLAGESMAIGRYELRFHIGPYFAARGDAVADPPYLDVVPVRFAIADPGSHYHVPLLCSPWSYTTYRGS